VSVSNISLFSFSAPSRSSFDVPFSSPVLPPRRRCLLTHRQAVCFVPPYWAFLSDGEETLGFVYDSSRSSRGKSHLFRGMFINLDSLRCMKSRMDDFFSQFKSSLWGCSNVLSITPGLPSSLLIFPLFMVAVFTMSCQHVGFAPSLSTTYEPLVMPHKCIATRLMVFFVL